ELDHVSEAGEGWRRARCRRGRGEREQSARVLSRYREAPRRNGCRSVSRHGVQDENGFLLARRRAGDWGHMKVKDAYLVDGVRTPVGNIGGGLAEVRADDLAAHVIAALMRRHPDVDPGAIADV